MCVNQPEIVMTKLTQKQADLFVFIKDFISENGYPPTRVEMADHFDIRPNAAQARMTALIKKGAVTHKIGVMRSTLPVKGFRVRIK